MCGGFNFRDNLVFSLAAAKSFHLLCCKWPGLYCVTGLRDEDMLTLSECTGCVAKPCFWWDGGLIETPTNVDSEFLTKVSGKENDAPGLILSLCPRVSPQLQCDTWPLVFLVAPPTWRTLFCVEEASLLPLSMWVYGNFHSRFCNSSSSYTATILACVLISLHAWITHKCRQVGIILTFYEILLKD